VAAERVALRSNGRAAILPDTVIRAACVGRVIRRSLDPVTASWTIGSREGWLTPQYL